MRRTMRGEPASKQAGTTPAAKAANYGGRTSSLEDKQHIKDDGVLIKQQGRGGAFTLVKEGSATSRTSQPRD